MTEGGVVQLRNSEELFPIGNRQGDGLSAFAYQLWIGAEAGRGKPDGDKEMARELGRHRVGDLHLEEQVRR